MLLLIGLRKAVVVMDGRGGRASVVGLPSRSRGDWLITNIGSSLACGPNRAPRPDISVAGCDWSAGHQLRNLNNLVNRTRISWAASGRAAGRHASCVAVGVGGGAFPVPQRCRGLEAVRSARPICLPLCGPVRSLSPFSVVQWVPPDGTFLLILLSPSPILEWSPRRWRATSPRRSHIR